MEQQQASYQKLQKQYGEIYKLDFYGRQKEITKLKNYILLQETTGVIMCAPKGSGKTQLLKMISMPQFNYQLEIISPKEKFIIIYLDLRKFNDLNSFTGSLINALKCYSSMSLMHNGVYLYKTLFKSIKSIGGQLVRIFAIYYLKSFGYRNERVEKLLLLLAEISRGGKYDALRKYLENIKKKEIIKKKQKIVDVQIEQKKDIDKKEAKELSDLLRQYNDLIEGDIIQLLLILEEHFKPLLQDEKPGDRDQDKLILLNSLIETIMKQMKPVIIIDQVQQLSMHFNTNFIKLIKSLTGFLKNGQIRLIMATTDSKLYQMKGFHDIKSTLQVWELKPVHISYSNQICSPLTQKQWDKLSMLFQNGRIINRLINLIQVNKDLNTLIPQILSVLKPLIYSYEKEVHEISKSNNFSRSDVWGIVIEIFTQIEKINGKNVIRSMPPQDEKSQSQDVIETKQFYQYKEKKSLVEIFQQFLNQLNLEQKEGISFSQACLYYDEKILEELIEKNVFYLEPFSMTLKKQYSYFKVRDNLIKKANLLVPKPKL